MAKEGQGSAIEWVTLIVGFAALIFPPFLHWYLHLATRDSWHIAIAGLAFLLLRGFWHSFSKYDELAEKQRPKLSVECDSDCSPVNQGNGGMNRYFRIRVQSRCDVPLTNCRAYLVSIKRNGGDRYIWGPDEEELSFAPWNPQYGQKEHPKTIQDDRFVHLDVLCVVEGGAVSIANLTRVWVNMPREVTIFGVPGEYLLNIQIVADGMRTITRTLIFTRTSNYMTCKMQLFTQPSSIPPAAASPQ